MIVMAPTRELANQVYNDIADVWRQSSDVVRRHITLLATKSVHRVTFVYCKGLYSDAGV